MCENGNIRQIKRGKKILYIVRPRTKASQRDRGQR